MAAQQSAANSARGANAMLAGRQAVRGAADLGLAGAGQASQAAMQDQTQARGLLAGVLGQGAGQDIGVAQANAQMQQQAALENMHAKLTQMGMNDAQALGYLAALTGMDQAELQARLTQTNQSIAQQQPGFAGDLLKTAGTIAAAAVA